MIFRSANLCQKSLHAKVNAFVVAALATLATLLQAARTAAEQQGAEPPQIKSDKPLVLEAEKL